MKLVANIVKSRGGHLCEIHEVFDDLVPACGPFGISDELIGLAFEGTPLTFEGARGLDAHEGPEPVDDRD